jgi:hypothetical protein
MCTTITEKVFVATLNGRLGSEGVRFGNTAGELVPEGARRGNSTGRLVLECAIWLHCILDLSRLDVCRRSICMFCRVVGCG